VLLDDGSAHDTRTYLEEVAAGRSEIVLERNQQARGYTRAANQGLALSSAECVILLNSDTIVTDWWADKLAHALFSTPGAGLVGPLSNAASYQSIPSIEGSGGQTAINPLPPGTTIGSLNLMCETWAEGRHFPRVPLVHGFCFGIARQVIDQIGYFDDFHFPNGYGEENDYCFRAIDAGFDGVIATDTFVFHAKTRSYTEADRLTLAATGGAAFRKLFGTARIRRATAGLASNPTLTHMRDCAAAYYRGHESTPVAPAPTSGDAAAVPG
jgi:GT2 family glycosyltransferase